MKRGYVHSLKSCILKNSDASQLLRKRLSVIVLLQVHSSYIITTFLYLYFIFFLYLSSSTLLHSSILLLSVICPAAPKAGTQSCWKVAKGDLCHMP